MKGLILKPALQTVQIYGNNNFLHINSLLYFDYLNQGYVLCSGEVKK